MRERCETEASEEVSNARSVPAGVPAVQSRVLELQRSAGNAAVAGLLRQRRQLARAPANSDDVIITEAKRMIASNDRAPSTIENLVRKFAKGRVAAPMKHATMLAAGARGYTFKYLPPSGQGNPYLSIGEDFVYLLAKGDFATPTSELAAAVKQIDGGDVAAATAAPAQGAVDKAPEAAPVPAAPKEPRKKPSGRNPRNGPFRQKVKELLAPFQIGKPVMEGSDEFNAILPASQVLSERQGKAISHYNKGTDPTSSKYSTCITFQNNIMNKAKSAVLTKGDIAAGGKVERVGSDAETHLNEKKVPGAWNSGSDLANYDPEEGDIYIFYFPNPYPPNPKYAGGFSHTGFIRSTKDNGDGTQTWVTVDGGQGKAGALQVTGMTEETTPDGKVVKKYTYKPVITGAEAIEARVRTYDSKTGLVHGGENGDAGARVLRGWVDIDQIYTPPRAK